MLKFTNKKVKKLIRIPSPSANSLFITQNFDLPMIYMVCVDETTDVIRAFLSRVGKGDEMYLVFTLIKENVFKKR